MRPTNARPRSFPVVAVTALVTAAALSVPMTAPLALDAALSTAAKVAVAASPARTQRDLPTAAASRTQTDGVALIEVSSGSGHGAGTGMVLTADGEVLTNYHVVEGSTEIQVTIAATGHTYTATVLGHDATRDVALLQLEGAHGLTTVTPDKDPVRVGDPLTAVGNASGGGELVAASGTVTDLNTSVTVSSGTRQERLTGVVETTAGAVPGDSGGPMFDADGEVSGMTTAGGQTTTAMPGRRGRQITVTTVSYAVPIATALDVVDQIRSGTETTTVRIGPRAYLGVAVASEQNLIVSRVEPGTPAAGVGVAAGARIISLDGRRVSSHGALASVLGGHHAGDEVHLTWVDASGQTRQATLTLGASPVN